MLCVGMLVGCWVVQHVSVFFFEFLVLSLLGVFFLFSVVFCFMFSVIGVWFCGYWGRIHCFFQGGEERKGSV